jgi:hypothetical protein
MRESNYRSCQNIIHAYVDFVGEKRKEGWKPYLLTFQFIPLNGSKESVLRQMQNEIGVVYRKVINRVQRFSTTTNGSQFVPILLASPDLPVFKWERKDVLSDVVINEGIHYQGISLLPPRSRIECLRNHLIAYEKRYLEKSRLTKIDAERVESEIDKTCHYAFKSVEAGRFAYEDSFLVLPKAIAELD